MAKQALKRGTTSKIVRLFIQDSSSTTGAGLTGLVFNSASLVAYYIREGDAAATAITLATMTVGTWATGGFKEVDSTNMPGVYELGLPNAAISTGNSVLVMLKGATNMVPCALEYELDAYDPQDAAALGLSRLDAAVSSVAAAVWAVGSRTLTAFGFSVTASTVSDKTGYALTSGEHTAIATDAQTGLTAQGYSPTRATYLDTLNGLVAAVWGAATRTLSAFGFAVTVGGYSTGQDPATQVLATPANKLATTNSGQVDIDMAQAVPRNPTTGTTGDALLAAESDGFGAEALSGSTLTLKDHAGTTTTRTFTVATDSSGNPVSRT